MGTIADKLTYLGQTKAEIRDAILAKGVAVPAETTFREYAGKIREITTEGVIENPEEWKRPTEWLPIENSVVEDDQKFVGLYAILEDSNFIALSATGDYTVDWGDGVIENFVSGVSAYHIYTYDSFPGTTTSYGYRQAIVTVAPQSGQLLTSLNLQKRHNQAGLQSYSTGWLDMRMSGQNMTGLMIGGTIVYHRSLESFCFLGNNLITDFSRLFLGCNALQSIPLFDTANGTNFSNMFESCFALQSLPLLDTANGTILSNMFTNCKMLQKVPLFNTSKGTDFSFMFRTCTSLRTIPLLDTSSGTNFTYMFEGCASLQTIPLLNTINGTNFSSMFRSCASLQTVPLLDTAKGTDFNYMLALCSSLQTVPLLNTANGTNFYCMFGACTVLRTIPLLDTSNGTSFTFMFQNCISLQTIPLLNTAKGTSFSNMFQNCPSLQTIPQLNTSNGVAFSYMFSECLMLRTIPLLDTAKGTNFSNMFQSCPSLQALPLLNTSSGTNLGSMLGNCVALSKASFSGTNNTITYTFCKLSQSALVDIFNNLASGVVSKTITISSNWGAPLLTVEERAIATNKGWTIVG